MTHRYTGPWNPASREPKSPEEADAMKAQKGPYNLGTLKSQVAYPDVAAKVVEALRPRLDSILKKARGLPKSRHAAIIAHWDDREDELPERLENRVLLLPRKTTIWPRDYPLPFTVADALDRLDAGSPEIEGTLWVTANNIVRAVALLVPEEEILTIATRSDLVGRWPIFSAYQSAFLTLYRALERELDEGLGKWPGELAPLEVAEWACTKELVPPSLVGAVKGGDELPELFEYPNSHPALSVNLTKGSLAILYQAFTRAELLRPASLNTMLIPTDKMPQRFYQSIRGGTDRRNVDRRGGLEIYEQDGIVGMEFRWDDGTKIQMGLFDLQPNAEIFAAIEAELGDAAVRDMLGITTATWAAGARANQRFWWWPSEHQSMIGRADNKDNRRRLGERIDRLSHTTFTVRYKTGNPITGPVISWSATDGNAYLIALHPSLYQGIETNSFLAVPIDLLREPAGRTSGSPHMLAIILSRLWTRGITKGTTADQIRAEISPKKLVEMVGIRGRALADGRKTDGRAADSLEKSLKALQADKIVGGWHHEGGRMDRLVGKLIIRPHDEVLRRWEGANSGAIKRPAWLPSTGAELAELVTAYGTSKDMAAATGISDSTIRRVMRSHYDRPLPYKVRKALRIALRGA